MSDKTAADKDHGDSLPVASRSPRGITSLSLEKLIFKAEVPEEYIRSLPAQTLHLALRRNGLGSSLELIEAAGLEQCRLLTDLDLWDGDEFQEENFWEWLSLSDADDDLKFLQRFVKYIDLKLIALMLQRYVDVRVYEDSTEQQPGPDYYTPDRGHTWLKCDAPDRTKNFLLAKLLALIFESDAQAFYQLISVPSVSTPSELTELAFEEREKRLLCEGFPDAEYAHQLNTPLSEQSVKAKIAKQERSPIVENIEAVQPLLYDSKTVEPLQSLFIKIADRSEFEAEFTQLMNAALLRWHVKQYDFDAVVHWANKVKGALNIGLESVLEFSNLDPVEIYSYLGLQGLYRFGLDRLFQLRNQFANLTSDKAGDDQIMATVIEAASLRFPEIPNFLGLDGSYEYIGEGKLMPGFRALEHLSEIRLLSKL